MYYLSTSPFLGNIKKSVYNLHLITLLIGTITLEKFVSYVYICIIFAKLRVEKIVTLKEILKLRVVTSILLIISLLYLSWTIKKVISTPVQSNSQFYS